VANSRPGNYDALYVNNTAATDYQMRLVLLSVTNQSDCLRCALWVSNLSSGAKRVHINVTSGVVQQTTGPWENLTRDGTSGDEYHVWAEHNVSTGKEVKVAYAMEYTPRGKTSPTVLYANMTFVGRGVIAVTNNLFTPATFTIRAGDSVTWRWVEGRHGVEDLTNNLWCAEQTAPASDCSRVFPTAGIYAYRCTRHAAMVGTITVSAT
jgi:plastocyanin